MIELIKYIVQAMFDHPEQVEGIRISVLKLAAAKADWGKIIGMQGRNVGAIRTILGAASGRVKNARSLRLFDNPVEKCCYPLYKILKSGTPRHKPLQMPETIGNQCPAKTGSLGHLNCLAESSYDNC